MAELKDGIKYDEGKPRMDLIEPAFLLGIGKVLEMGARKYEANNWKKLPDIKDRCYAAAQRHLNQWRTGDTIDKESGLNHLLHAATNIMFLLWDEEEES